MKIFDMAMAINNSVTVVCATCLVGFLFWFSHGSWHALWGLVLMINLQNKRLPEQFTDAE